MTDRKPPADHDAEGSLLGAAMYSPAAVDAAVAGCPPEDFHLPRHGHIAAAIAALADRRDPVDQLTVAAELERRGLLDQCGGRPYLAQLVSDVPAASNAAKYARIVVEHADRRRLITAGHELAEAGYSANGDRESAIRRAGERLAALSANGGPLDEDDLARDQRRRKVIWADFWSTDATESDWLVEPLLVRCRAHALYAPAKAGKSLFALEVAAALANGRPVLRQPAGPALNVAYFDFEMTEDDLRERLAALGYDATADLSHLHYFLLPNLPPLDTPEGGIELARIIADHQIGVVIIDTTGRAVAGEEDSADTILDYYRHTGLRLKQAGVTSLRVDHAGKELKRGQRGTSAKNDDVDIVWELNPAETGITLKATHRRLGWVPSEVNYHRQEEPTLRHIPADELWPAGTAEVAALLDTHGVALDASVRDAEQALRAANSGRRQVLVRAALKWRRQSTAEPR